MAQKPMLRAEVYAHAMRASQNRKNSSSSSSLLMPSFLSALDISCAVSVVVFALDSPEREKREGSTTPCGVKDVVGTSSRAQPGSDERRKQNVHFNGQQRFSPVACPALR